MKKMKDEMVQAHQAFLSLNRSHVARWNHRRSQTQAYPGILTLPYHQQFSDHWWNCAIQLNEKAFTELKQKLATSPVLQPPDLSKSFFVWTDASIVGFGAVLEQLDDQNHRHPIAFASRQTNPAERKYAPTELEVAALIFAIEYFEVYLLGNQFTV